MERIQKFILRHKLAIIIFFAVSTGICLIMAEYVDVNYDMAFYLPDSADSTFAIDVMESEFEGGVPNARVMVGDITIPQAIKLKEDMLNINGIEEVMWLDDAADINTPIEFMDEDTLNNYYKNNSALFNITVDSDIAVNALNEIREITDKPLSMSGTVVDTAVATEKTSQQITMIIMLVIPLCFIILLLTSNSWFEPVLFMITIGVAIVLNRGTNLIFGEISFVTNASGSILQLAVSMDYAIFLLHRFSDYRNSGMDVEGAMIKAVRNSFFSILASGLTTVIGFAALIIMRFKLGPDMGYVMAKAIILSMLTVLILLPVLAMLCYKLIDKTHHRSFIPGFGGFASIVTRFRLPAIVIFIIVLVPCFLAQNSNKFLYGTSMIFGPGTDTYEEKQAIENVFGKSNQMVLLVPNGDLYLQTELSSKLQEIPQISSIISYVDMVGAEIPYEIVDDETLSKLVGQNYSRMILTIDMDLEGEETFSVVKKIRETAKGYYEDYHLAGSSVNTYDIKEVTAIDMKRVNILAIAAVFLVILLTMKSFLLPAILVLVIETSIWINLSIPYFGDYPLFYITYLIITSVQLGATVDYAIMFSSRYIETRKSRGKKEALLHVIKYTTLPILTSAAILTLSGLLLGIISTHGIISELGILIFRGTILSCLLVLIVLPAFLYILDRPILGTTLNMKKGSDQNENA